MQFLVFLFQLNCFKFNTILKEISCISSWTWASKWLYLASNFVIATSPWVSTCFINFTHLHIFALVKYSCLFRMVFLCFVWKKGVETNVLNIKYSFIYSFNISRENFFRCWICCWYSQSWIPYKLKYYRASNFWLYKRGSSAPDTCVS